MASLTARGPIGKGSEPRVHMRLRRPLVLIARQVGGIEPRVPRQMAVQPPDPGMIALPPAAFGAGQKPINK